MPILQFNLRKIWPLSVAALAFLTLALMYSSTHPQPTASFYQPKIGDQDDYITLLAQHSIRSREYPALFVLGITTIALVSLFGLGQASKWNIILTIILVLFTLWWTMKIMGDSAPQDGTILKNIQSIQFKQVSYKLTLSSTLGSGADWLERDFLVHECDGTDQDCKLVNFFLDENYQLTGTASNPSLIINSSTNTLYIQIGDQKTMIAR